MRQFLLAAMLVMTTQVQAQSILYSWPRVGGWQTSMANAALFGPVCLASTLTLEGTRFSFVLSREVTHLYLGYGNRRFPLSDNLAILIDGEPIYVAPLFDSGMDRMSNFFVIADLPGSVLIETLMPRLMPSKSMQFYLGVHAFTIATDRFPEVALQLHECAVKSTEH